MDIEEEWLKNLNLLIFFIEWNKRFPSKSSKKENEVSLWNWVKMQKDYKEKNCLSKYRIDKLELIPDWEWSNTKVKRNVKIWSSCYNDLIIFLEGNNGKFPSRLSTDKREKRLYNWVCCQKSRKKKNKLSEEKINKLELIPFWSWCCSRNEKWFNKNKDFLNSDICVDSEILNSNVFVCLD